MPRICFFNARYLFFGSEEIQHTVWEMPDDLAPITVVLFKTPEGEGGEKSDSVPILFLASFHRQFQLLKTGFHVGLPNNLSRI